jgi:hypothetical protein
MAAGPLLEQSQVDTALFGVATFDATGQFRREGLFRAFHNLMRRPLFFPD